MTRGPPKSERVSYIEDPMKSGKQVRQRTPEKAPVSAQSCRLRVGGTDLGEERVIDERLLLGRDDPERRSETPLLFSFGRRMGTRMKKRSFVGDAPTR